MKTNFEYRARPKNQRLADLERKKAELERELLSTRESLGRELEREPDGAAEYDPGVDYQPELTLDDEAQWPPEHEDEPMLRIGPERTVTLDAPPPRHNGRAHDRSGHCIHGAAVDLDASYGTGPAARNGGRSRHAANDRGRAGRGAGPEPVHDPEPQADYGPDGWPGDDAAAEQVSGAWHRYDGHPGLGLDGYPGFEPEPGNGHQHPDPGDDEADDGMTSLLEPARRDDYAAVTAAGDGCVVEDRTDVLINHGRPSAHQRRMTGRLRFTAVAVVAVVLTAIVVVMLLPGPGPSWPRSVARVQTEIATACQNPDVRSEPGQLNFACGRDTRQILWVFSLLTSADNPTFADSHTGRVGLEPITPAQGGQVAWSLNLHHPYDPSNPIDSLQVAARAINNIIAGATITGAYGNPIVQAGLEGHAANCVRYTGSPALTSHKGFPRLCARPISSTAGQAALVADVFQKWVVGAAPVAAQNAATLYANARNPGSPQVQAILKQLPHLSG